MKENKFRFGISSGETDNELWSVGLCLTHYCDETYLYIALFKYEFCIGWMWLPTKGKTI